MAARGVLGEELSGWRARHARATALGDVDERRPPGSVASRTGRRPARAEDRSGAAARPWPVRHGRPARSGRHGRRDRRDPAGTARGVGCGRPWTRIADARPPAGGHPPGGVRGRPVRAIRGYPRRRRTVRSAAWTSAYPGRAGYRSWTARRALDTLSIVSASTVPSCSASRLRSTGSIDRARAQPCSPTCTARRLPGSSGTTCRASTIGRRR